MKPKIFAFINGGAGTDWVNVDALAEDGHFLAGHISSSDGWARHDIGIASDLKHDAYQKHYPDGYELEWVDGDPRDHVDLMAAYEKYRDLPGGLHSDDDA